MAFTGNEDHKIDIEDGAILTRRYRDEMELGIEEEEIEDYCLGGYFSKAAIQTLLAQRDCVGIRVYYGLDADGTQKLVLVGVDANENDQVGVDHCCADAMIPCPESCGNDNMLNSDM